MAEIGIDQALAALTLELEAGKALQLSPRKPTSALTEASLRQLVDNLTSDPRKGAAHPHTITAMACLVDCLLEMLKFEDALPLAQHVLKWYERIGDSQTDLFNAMTNLATCLKGLGRFEEAEALSIKVLNIAQQELGHEDRSTITACSHLATVWISMDKHAEAEGMLRRVVDFNIRLLGWGHEDTIFGVVNLGTCLSNVGKTDEALPLLHKGLELNIRAHGLQHRSSIHTMHVFGKTLAKALDFVQAEQVLRRCLTLGTTVLGPTHPITLDCIAKLSELPVLDGERYADALPLCRQGLEMHQRAYGEADDHPETLRATHVLAGVLFHLRQYSESEPLARRSLEGYTRLLGADHAYTKSAASLVQAMAPALPRRSRAGRGRGRAARR